MLRVAVSITVIVSCPLLATNTRLPSGEVTMFHGSAPVVRFVTTLAVNVPHAGSLIRIAVTVPAAAFAIHAYWPSGVRAMLCGSVPTLILAIRVLLSGRKTLTELSPGFTDQISLSFSEMAMGL